MRYFWIATGAIAAAVTLVAGLTFATLGVLARAWDPIGDVRAQDLAGRWIGVSPVGNGVVISFEAEGHRAAVKLWPGALDCNVGRIGPSDLGDIEWTPSSSFQADAYPPDGAPVLYLRNYEDESCPRSLRFTVEQNWRFGVLQIVYHVGALDDDNLDQALIFIKDDQSQVSVSRLSVAGDGDRTLRTSEEQYTW